MRKRIGFVVFLSSLLFGGAVAQEPVTPWRNDPVFQRLATVLDKVPAIDMHTHLLRPGYRITSGSPELHPICRRHLDQR